ncbi:hypothetical protein D6817_01660 [Candidatus Pacearchaeota archaeon]|nr:MAG: hypothetical protein D6817_01660 [Candidatus Pacearchaeota archaeon]
MLGLFKKKKSSEEASEEGSEETSATPAKAEKSSASIGSSSGGAGLVKLSTEVDRLKAAIESFNEARKAMTERISRVSEQIGELRAMILDRDRTIQEIELKAVKAADLVESVQPDKLMTELQKEDAKIEALKANLEGNEAIMDRIMNEMKELRKKMEFLRGIDEIVKLSEEVKSELVEIKKVQAQIHVDADKVETIYAELRKKFKEIDLFSDSLNEFKVKIEQNTKDIDVIKTKISGLAEKEELDRLVQKVQKYIDVLKEIDKRSSLSKDLAQLKTLLESFK